MRRLLVSAAAFFLLGWMPTPGAAQELQCRVSVDYQQLAGSDYAFLFELGELAEEYLNERRWTRDRFLEHERIRCSINLIIQEAVTLTRFSARVVVTSQRPIYGTTQSTPVLRINDTAWEFSFAQGDPLVFDPDRFDDLASVLDFYAYLILGYDYDTFSERGGTPYFERARRIAELGQRRGGPGWSAAGTQRSRTELITQLLDARMRPLRQAAFDYHLKGLDRFVTETEEARAQTLAVLENLEALSNSVARQYALDHFFDTKAQEITALFEGSPLSAEAYALLSQADPSNLSEYERLSN